MRLGFKILAIAAFVLFAALAVFSADAHIHLGPRAGTFWLVAGLLALGLAAKLTLPFTLFGAHVNFAAPLLLLLMAPYALRLGFGDVFARALASWFPRAPEPPARPRPSPPYALPNRVAVALAAAARARNLP